MAFGKVRALGSVYIARPRSCACTPTSHKVLPRSSSTEHKLIEQTIEIIFGEPNERSFLLLFAAKAQQADLELSSSQKLTCIGQVRVVDRWMSFVQTRKWRVPLKLGRPVLRDYSRQHAVVAVAFVRLNDIVQVKRKYALAILRVVQWRRHSCIDYGLQTTGCLLDARTAFECDRNDIKHCQTVEP